jgi:asparagine synthase (glutamine-hydrolysing)
MSGIVGVYYLDGRPVERDDVERMVESIPYRGPDGSGVWTDGSVGLGHQMLWTTPESLHEKLPLTNHTRDLTLTADARIDNRDELIDALNLNGRPRETITDSELILVAYEKWGEQCPEKLLGDFSFAIWDKRKQKIFCARDPIGIKPFYYFFNGKTFRWSSEPKAIFEDKTIPKEPNLQLICLYLLNRFDEREETLYQNIYRLPPSHFMVLENGQIRKGQYWDIDPNHSIRYKTDAEYAEHFLTLFKEAVKVRLRSHGPVGAWLSGGLDSSSIVCTAQKLYRENSVPNHGFETFSVVFDTFTCDERNYIDEVVRKWDIKKNYVTYEKNLSWVDFEKTRCYPDVAYSPTLLCTGPVLMEAQEKGIKVMLDGIGGDEFLALDFNHLTDLLVKGSIFKLIAQIKHDAALSSHSLSFLFLNYCMKPLIPRPMKTGLRFLLKPFRGNGIPSWMNIDYLKKEGLSERLKTRVPSPRFPTHAQQKIYEVLYYGWGTNVAQEGAERFSAIFSSENRYPFFDRRLVEFSIALPVEQRWRNEVSKAILRRAMEGILPESVKNRKDKADFTFIFDHELKERQVTKLYELFRSSTLADLGIVHKDRLQELLEDYRHASPSNGIINNIIVIVWLELWSRSQWTDLRKEEVDDPAKRFKNYKRRESGSGDGEKALFKTSTH